MLLDRKEMKTGKGLNRFILSSLVSYNNESVTHDNNGMNLILDMKSGDRNYLILRIRMNNYGEELDFNYKCPACGKTSGYHINFQEALDNGELADQLPEAEVFMAELDAWGRARISFGNGHAGKIPPEDEDIIVAYRVGGGVVGNVAPHTIKTVRNVAKDANNEPVTVYVDNESWAGGGAEPESLESIRLWAPRYYEAQNRCVTQRDYETLAMNYEGIAKARAVVRERTGEANVVRYYVLTYGLTNDTVAVAPQVLKNNLLEYLNGYKMLTDLVEVEDGRWREIDVSGILTISQGFNASMVVNNVKEALKKLLSIEVRDMGQSLRISDVYSAIDNIEGVVHVELADPTATVEADNDELLVLGDTDFKVIMEGASLELYEENF